MKWYPWPGNVRELRNVVERAKILCDGDEILPEHLNLPANTGSDSAAASTATSSLADMEWRMIQSSLRSHGGNKTAAARSLGISLRTLYNKLEAKAQEAAEVDAAVIPSGTATARM
jgi:DNA-binding NtrC family response regulator